MFYTFPTPEPQLPPTLIQLAHLLKIQPPATESADSIINITKEIFSKPTQNTVVKAMHYIINYLERQFTSENPWLMLETNKKVEFEKNSEIEETTRFIFRTYWTQEWKEAINPLPLLPMLCKSVVYCAILNRSLQGELYTHFSGVLVGLGVLGSIPVGVYFLVIQGLAILSQK